MGDEFKNFSRGLMFTRDNDNDLHSILSRMSYAYNASMQTASGNDNFKTTGLTPPLSPNANNQTNIDAILQTIYGEKSFSVSGTSTQTALGVSPQISLETSSLSNSSSSEISTIREILDISSKFICKQQEEIQLLKKCVYTLTQNEPKSIYRIEELEKKHSKLSDNADHLNNEVEKIKLEQQSSIRFYQSFTKLSDILITHQRFSFFLPIAFIICSTIAMYLLSNELNYNFEFYTTFSLLTIFSALEFIDIIHRKISTEDKIKSLEDRLNKFESQQKDK